MSKIEEPSSSQSHATRIGLLRLFSLLIALVAGLGAVYIFYLQPWLKLSSVLDPWIAKQSCLIRTLCTPPLLFGNHLGLLLAICAVAGFGVAFVGAPFTVRRNPVTLSHPSNPSTAEERWRRPLLIFLVVFGAIMVAQQAVMGIQGVQASRHLYWLLGLVAWAVTAAMWDDASSLNPVETVRKLAIAGSVGLILLALGGSLVDNTLSMLLLTLGVVGFGVGLVWLHNHPTNSKALQSVDYIIALALAATALLLGLNRMHSWEYAFVGDEWSFYVLAHSMLNRPDTYTLFGLTDFNAYHSEFSSWLQAWVMGLAEDNVYGWRLSSLLPVVLSVPAIYAFAHWLGGRSAAVLAASALAGSHLLFSFTKVGYNNSQGLLVLATALALFAFATRATSTLRHFLLGIAVGSGFLVFSLARLVVLPIGILFLLHPWRTKARFFLAALATAAGVLATAAPMLFDVVNWRGLLKATPIQSEVASTSAELAKQILQNLVTGLQVFLVSNRHSHFVVGPHVDPITAVLMLAGLAAGLVALRRRRALAWLLSSTVFGFAVIAIQQYAYVATTRMFILTPLYAIYAGVGGAAICVVFLQRRKKLHFLFVALVAIGMLASNQLHLAVVSQSHYPFQHETLLLQQLLATSQSTGGAPAVFLVDGDSDDTRITGRISEVMDGYSIEPGRLKLLTAEDALSMPSLCEGDMPRILLMRPDTPHRDEIRQRVESCWATIEQDDLTDRSGSVLFVRLSHGVKKATIAAPFWSFPRAVKEVGLRHVPQPGDIAHSAGDLFVLSRTAGDIWHFSPAGDLVKRIPLIQQKPTALTASPQQELIVGAPGDPHPLVWYDLDGRVVRKLAVADAPYIAQPLGLAVAATGDIFVADPTVGAVLRLTPEGELAAIYTANGRLQQPTSLTLRADERSLWVLNASCAEWVNLTLQDQVRETLPAGKLDPWSAPRLVVDADDQQWLSVPVSQSVELHDSRGQTLDRWNGFGRPTGLTIDEAGRLFVADDALDQVVLLPQVTIPRSRMGAGSQATLDDAPTDLTPDEQIGATSNGLADLLRQYRLLLYRLPSGERSQVLSPLLDHIRNASVDEWNGLALEDRIGLLKLPDPALQEVLRQHPAPTTTLTDASGQAKLNYQGMTPDQCAGGYRSQGIYFRLVFDVLEAFDEDYMLWFHIVNIETNDEYMLYDYTGVAGTSHWKAGEPFVAPIILDVPAGVYDVAFGFWTADRRRLYVDRANDIYWISLGVLEAP